MKKKYLIITAGRTGSSVLAAVMNRAGADFGLGDKAEWNRKLGAFEHPLLWRAQNWHSKSRKIEESLIPNSIGLSFCRKKVFATLGKVVSDVDFLKSITLVNLTWYIEQMGYKPVIILSFRNFRDYSLSYLSAAFQPNRGYQNTVREYVDTYATGLLQLSRYGGAVVSYDDVINFDKEGWAEQLEDWTKIGKEKLLQARNELVKARNPKGERSYDVPYKELSNDVKEIEGVLADLARGSR